MHLVLFDSKQLLYKFFMNDLDERIERELVKFYDTHLGEIANTVEDRLKIHKEFDRFVHWALAIKMQFSSEKSKVLHLGMKNQLHKYGIGGTWMNNNNCETDLGILEYGNKS